MYLINKTNRSGPIRQMTRDNIKDMNYLTDTIVDFKSVSPFFEKEHIGVKPNTVREINLSEDKFQDLLMMYNFGIYGWIRIKKDSKNEKFPFFERRIEDISIWNNLMIISWKHKDL